MDFVTLGMFIIDEIHYQPPRKADINVMGGAGLYAALGARIFRPVPLANKVGWIVHQGYDFPLHIKATIDSWNTSCEFIPTPERATTRASNRYEQNGHRAFEYLTSKVRVDEKSLTVAQLTSKGYHLICSANRCIDLVNGITARRRIEAGNYEHEAETRHLLTLNPVFIWEPVPDLCVTSELAKSLDALRHVDVFSPNLEEFCSLFGISIDLDGPSGWAQLHQRCKEIVEPTTSKPRAIAVIRLGEKGCFVVQPGQRHMRLPAYYARQSQGRAIEFVEGGRRNEPANDNESSANVVDPTGGGNAFLGGFAIGLQNSGRFDIKEAALYGTIAASFAIEQVGVPTLALSASGEETWNDDSVERRLTEYSMRIADEVDRG
ncbi:MAG: hypothetical protein L6R40_003263 [Gallowayella cf. fulva]|nr:MAG: hypothetical protein L6R40_003263 [Xanthomendoza cf. fulva]